MSLEFSLSGLACPDAGSFDPELCLRRIGQGARDLHRVQPSGPVHAALCDRLARFTAGIAELLHPDSRNAIADDEAVAAPRRQREQQYTDLLDAFHAAETLHAAPGDGLSAADAGEIPENTLLLIELAELRADCRQLHNHVARGALERRKAPRWDPVEAWVAAAGFASAERALARLAEWRSGYPSALRRPRERKALEVMLPDLIRSLGQVLNPDRTLATLDLVLSRLPATTGLFTQCHEQPELLPYLLKILSSSPELARLMEAYPHFLNRVVDGGVDVPLADDDGLDAEFLRLANCRASGRNQQLIAERVHFHRFALGVQALRAGADPLELAARMSDLGEAAVRVACRIATRQMRLLHGSLPGGELVVLALGRFGGREMTHHSDLDLIFVHTGRHSAHSDGARPLDANEYFCRMASAVTGLLSTMTPLGPLYAVDTRLRPWGGKGQLACSLQYFERYFRENAQTWENMALTRARVISGSARARAAMGAVLTDQLQQFRSADRLIADARSMRARMALHKPPRDAFDVKLVDGGLVDLEFAVHIHQLRDRMGLHANLAMAIRALCAQGLVGEALVDAHRVLTRLLISLRAYTADMREPDPAQRGQIAQACGFGDWPALTAAYAQARQTVRSEWIRATDVNAVSC